MRYRPRFASLLLLVYGFALAIVPLRPAGASLSVQPINNADTVVMTVYEQGDLTLMEEHRSVVLEEGINRLEFSWKDRSIDPSSLKLTFSGENRGFHVKEISYPGGRDKTVVWVIEARKTVRTEAVVSYFFTGVTVEPVYDFTREGQSETARLNGRFKLVNRTGDKLEPSSLRVLIGEVNLLESIESIIRKWSRSRDKSPGRAGTRTQADQPEVAERRLRKSRATMMSAGVAESRSARVTSDYHLISLERKLSLPGESTSYVPFITRGNVNFDEMYESLVREGATSVKKTIRIPNTVENNLGAGVLPEGSVNLLERGNRGAPAWIGESTLEYASPTDTATVDVSRTPAVTVERKLLSLRKEDFEFDEDRTLTGWHEVRKEKIAVRNHRNEAVALKVIRDFDRDYWTFLNASHSYRTVSSRRVAFPLELPADSSVTLTVTYRFPFGSAQ